MYTLTDMVTCCDKCHLPFLNIGRSWVCRTQCFKHDHEGGSSSVEEDVADECDGRPRLACWPSNLGLRLRWRWRALGQRKYLRICRTKGFPASTNSESNRSVRALMWSAKNGTPKSSWICLLLMYQGAPVAAWKQLDWITCSFLTWEQVADLQIGHL